MTRYITPCHRRGYALLMTLVLLTMVGAMLAMTARASARHALEAVDAGEQLQRKWAMRSCESLLLPGADQVLAETDTTSSAAGGSKTHQVVHTVQLMDLRIELVFASEDAKLNINALLEWQRPRDAESTITQLMHATHASGIVDFPRIIAEEAPLLVTWDDWMRDAGPAQITSGVARTMTCWSDGPVDFHRAPREVLEAALQPDLGMSQLGKLMKLREEEPDIALGTVLSRLELTHQQRQRIAKRLTDQSSAYSLWTVMHDRHRSWYAFATTNEKSKERPSVRLRW